jgi:hypothetical protein
MNNVVRFLVSMTNDQFLMTNGGTRAERAVRITKEVRFVVGH